MRKLLLVIVSILVVSCSGIPQKAKLTLPPETTCPEFTDAELSAVNDTTYSKIVVLDIICRETIQTYRDIIKSTH